MIKKDDGNTFRVNGHRLKPYLEDPSNHIKESEALDDVIISGA